MKRYVFIFFLFPTITLLGQKSMYRPFKMVIVAPDTATIHKELLSLEKLPGIGEALGDGC
jgi:hypothetical protein